MSKRPEIIPTARDFGGGGCWSGDWHGHRRDIVSGGGGRLPEGGRQDAKVVPGGRLVMTKTFRSPRSGRPAMHQSSDDCRPANSKRQHLSGVRPAFRRRSKPRARHPFA
jgi:hypothetical protein